MPGSLPRRKRSFGVPLASGGQSVNEFVVVSAVAAAEEALRAPEVIVLSPADSVGFVEALLNPPAPNDALLKAMARRHKMADPPPRTPRAATEP
jgi:hypothetical protein